METFELSHHPAHPPLRVSAVAARIIGFDANWLTIRWKIDGAAALVVPPFAGKARADGLWQTTCFELFVQGADAPAYAEFNFSPSERWAAYSFADIRAGMIERAVAPQPTCTPRRGQDVLIFDAVLASSALPPLPARYGLTAVIEEEGGHKSYWAMAHGRDRPDFHDPACFCGHLAAPQAA